MSISSIKNYLQVSPTIASSGQPEKHQFKSISDEGYKIVINLAMADSNNAIPEEGSIVASLGMSYLHIPVPFDSPKISQLQTFARFMQSSDQEKVWVHCVLNYRVSAFLYLYHRLAKGVSDDEAQSAMFPDWEPDEVWSSFLKTTREEAGLGG